MSASIAIRPNLNTLKRFRGAVSVALAFIVVASFGLFVRSARHSSTPTLPAPSQSSQLTTAQVRQAYGQISLSFEANHGQADAAFDFLARGAGYSLGVSPTEAVLTLARQSDEHLLRGETSLNHRDKSDVAKQAKRDTDTLGASHSQPLTKVLRMKLVGAGESASVEVADELPGKVNYFIGSDPSQWRTGVPTFGRVHYREIYPGVDVIYYGNQRQLEYDFVVAPGRDASVVKLQFSGADRIEIDAAGDLLLSVGDTVIRQPKPFVYQEISGARRVVEGGYAVGANGQVSFALGDYDARLPLVIDPTLVYSTYLGGNDTEEGSDIRVDSGGSAYICGITNSTNFPTANAFQGTFNAPIDNLVARDGFVTKLNPAGTALVYSTYLGGNKDDRCNKIAVDSAGNAYVAGETGSTNFPTVNAFQGTFGGGLSDAYVTKLNPAGSVLVYSTYLGGTIFDAAHALTIDSAGNTYVTGRTTSADFPTVNPIQAVYSGGPGADAFVTKINAGGSALVYSTYLGGNGGNGFTAGFSIAVDSSGSAYLTGQTRATDFPTVNPIQGTFGGGFPDGDAFVTKLNAAGSALVYSTYLGGSDNDIGFEIAVDSAGSAHVVGSAFSNNFPVANAFQGTLKGTSDGFVTKFNAAGSAFAYSTYLGGTGGDSSNGIALDSAGNTYVALGTTSTDFPTVNPTQGTSGGGVDGFVAKFNAAGSALLFSTYLGGSGNDAALAIALDSAGSMYIAGRTASTNFPTLNPVQSTNGGGTFDVFVTKISDAATPSPATIQFSQSNYTVSESAGFVNVNVTRTGDTSTTVAVDYTTSDNSNAMLSEAEAVALCGGVNSVALSKCDFNTALGTLRFAAGETTKSFTVLLTQDSYVEGTEFAPLTLSNPTNGAVLGNQSTAMLQINDDPTEPSTNAIDDNRNFVRQHYHDFLNREPDQPGWDFWTDNITKCTDPARRPAGQTEAQCIDKQRETTSGAFFLSPEFGYTGQYVYVVYKGSLGRMPTFREFMRDVQQVSRGIIVGNAVSASTIEANRAQYLTEFLQRPEFANIYAALTNQAYVDKLFQTTGTNVSSADRQALVTGLNGATETRATVLHKVVNGTRVLAEGQVEITAAYGKAFLDSQFSPSFVQMEYFGYLRRNEDTPGFNFWLNKLNSFGGDFIKAEMVRSFLMSPEYRRRFGPQQ
jgi:hypothetical protein